MSMTSREIVQRTLDFDNPERVARSFGESDFVGAGCTVKTRATNWQKIDGNRWERTDEWGNTWARIDSTSKGEVTKGVLEDISALYSYQFPDYSRSDDYAVAVECRKSHPDKWIHGILPGFAFSIARKMRKLDQYLMDLIIEKDSMHELHDRIDVMLEDMIRNYAASGADGLMFWEDWGTQQQTMISPDMWHEEFYPRFVKLCHLAHDLGLKVFMHSCGQIEAIVPWLLEAGIDVLQFDQPNLHGIDILAAWQEQYKTTFWCPVDIQDTLQLKNESTIRAKAREMLDKLWRKRGGFIAGFYSDNISLGLDPRWQGYACNEFIKRGVR